MDQNTELPVEPQPNTNEFCSDAEMYEIIENCISHTDGGSATPGGSIL